MPALRKDPARITNKNICIRIYADDEKIKGTAYWKQLAQVFAMLSSKFNARQIELMLKNNTLAAKIIEVLPEVLPDEA